jgi:hypothetical protein
MDRDSLEKLRLDRRLIRRRGWIAPDDLDREIDSLPDVAHKIAPSEKAESTDSPSSDEPGSR